MHRMKFYLKSKDTFGPEKTFRRAHTYLANYVDIWVNLLYLPDRVRFSNSMQPVTVFV